MDGEKKFVLVMVGLTAICITVLCSFLFIALWDYRQLVGLSLLVVIILVVWVFLRGRLTEQDLRVARFRHHEETPLDSNGEPLFWQSGYQANPHRR
jgi:membrane protein implicated in regulation of membrane protease activity